MPSMSTARQHIERLAPLVGVWRGTGTARFPTIETGVYREELRFDWNTHEALLHYEQRTWWKEDEPLHWQSGFLIADEAGALTLSNSQNNGRVEVLAGSFSASPARLEIDLESRHFGNDPRMVASRRRFVLEGDRLAYEMSMTTTRVPALTPHLQASLRRA